jgi:hypothetical protein
MSRNSHVSTPCFFFFFLCFANFLLKVFDMKWTNFNLEKTTRLGSKRLKKKMVSKAEPRNGQKKGRGKKLLTRVCLQCLKVACIECDHLPFSFIHRPLSIRMASQHLMRNSLRSGAATQKRGHGTATQARPRTCTAAAAACRCGERCGVRSVQRRFEIFGKICRRDFAGTLLVSSFQSVQCFLDAHNWALELKQNEIVSKSR